MFGLSDSEYQYILNTVVKPLEANNAQVFCFGSRARGTHSRFSDLDLLLKNAVSLKELVNEISETLENENFPYKVDLVFEEELAHTYQENVKADLKHFS